MKKIIFLFVIIITALIVAATAAAINGRFGIFIPITILFPIVILAFIFSIIGKSRGENEKLLKTGLPAKAKILSVSDTGVKINYKPRIALELEVTPQTGSPFNAKIYTLVSFFQQQPYQPGMIVNVRYYPDNLKAVALEPSTSDANNGYGTVKSKNENLPGQNNFEIKPLICPSCGGQIKVDSSLINEKIITCSYCGTAIDLHE
jgi:hypothetical protein